jgi:hypothetical protein
MISGLSLVATPAHAGERMFAFTYGADTVPKGGIELEHYLTAETHGDSSTTDWEQQVELEYGISNKLEAGLYVVGQQVGGGPLAFGGYKARLRYRLAPMDQWPVNVALYGEYVGVAGANERALEEKLILSKRIKRFETALNLTVEEEIGEGEVATILEPTLGVGVHLAPWATLGAEAKYETELGEDFSGVWAGPNFHLAGEGGRFWWTFAAMYGLTPDTRADAEWEVRSLLAVNL